MLELETQVPNTPAEENIEGYEEPTPGGWDGYPLDELVIRDERRAVQDVVRRISHRRFILDPDFQRPLVWDRQKQSRLIESILMRIPLPVFYVAEDMDGRMVVVDGRQRLTTLQEFIAGDLKLDLKDRPELDRKKFQDLEPRLQYRIEDCQLHFYIIAASVPERAKLDIFERVNGGEVLTRQEMRNALFSGPATKFLGTEAGSELFVKATGNSLNQSRMRDREFVNRFCSFSLLPLDAYRGNMDEWLAESLKMMNRAESGQLEDLRRRLHTGLTNNLAVFGKYAFRKHKATSQERGIINASLYDVMSTGLSTYEPELVAGCAEALRAAFFDLLADKDFEKAITYGPNTRREVNTRFRMANEMLSKVLDV